MPPKRDPRRDQAAEIYRKHNGRIDLAAIAEQLGVSAGTVRGWKSKDRAAWGIGTEQGPERSEKRSKRSDRKKPVAAKVSPADQLIVEAALENEVLTDKERLFCLLYVKTFNATQAYLEAYNCKYTTANAEGPALLVKPRIREEIQRLKKIKSEAILATKEDILELHSRIAFADMNRFAEYENLEVPLLVDGAPVPRLDPETGDPLQDPETGEPLYVMRKVNEVRFRSSEVTDGQLVSEISQGRDGAKIKLRNADRSLQFLEKYHDLIDNGGNTGSGVEDWLDSIIAQEDGDDDEDGEK